jgi:hypothetical protein
MKLLTKTLFTVACGLLLTSTPLRANSITMTFSACIDGQDELIIRGNTVQWEYLSFTPVGTWRGDCGQTTTSIDTTWNGNPVQSVQWQPEFSPYPPYSGQLSSTFNDLSPALPSTDMSITLTTIQGREYLGIAQLPNAADNWTLILDFNDNNVGGAAVYEGELTISNFSLPMPEPGSLILLGSGLLGVAGAVRRKCMG